MTSGARTSTDSRSTGNACAFESAKTLTPPQSSRISVIRCGPPIGEERRAVDLHEDADLRPVAIALPQRRDALPEIPGRRRGDLFGARQGAERHDAGRDVVELLASGC